ncbi:EndoU domain-containing protein [Clostridium saccharobutylicum]|uniref:Transposase protein n=1 Tax=Clostridium saccharobutylicum DSM 13864 TaxID=1345695 RepID=U5MVC5_CLOSA|nr:EndoU domain-containing protein [Clostridium saccharobutylicum]AGX44478.1 transposase protein [Clostridium saccharobutylicum DSM 13864]AQR91773.1 hypothetical protein CLOSC_35010 [Clostridium saccharobutylicum]AQS01675.1 hypothetical protein CSACC_35060 [Clostridium saccharobutylicum]AQS15658.1 hypothetical protein CLOSACC_35060 [Clostridium saccharobutylicum]MBA2907434.1 hypothetical protein [Clostridium saccharobutylicum]
MCGENSGNYLNQGVSKVKDYGKYSTSIDDKVKVIDKVDLPDWIRESYTDGNYRTVITEENIIFYRTYGGGAKLNGSFVTTSPAGNRINAKITTALVPDWKNSRQYEAVIEVPKGQILNIGKVEKQYTKTGKVSKMKGGGHGQANIDFLDKNGIEYNIEKEYPNGVRVGNVPDHKVKAKRSGMEQSWFPKAWSESDIQAAGEAVANMSGNTGVADGVAVFGEYNGVRVGVIRTNGKIATVFPDSAMQPGD